MGSEVGGSEWKERGEAARRAAEEKAMRQLQLSAEELRVLRECNQESFWYRCVPLSILAMTATQLAVNRGMLRPHPKFGAALKNMGAGLAGYIVGKLSYTRACKEKVMQLENSELAQSLKRQKYGRAAAGQQSEFASDSSMPPLGGSSPSNFPSNQPSNQPLGDYRSRLDVSSDANTQYKGLDDTFRPTLDNVPTSSDQPKKDSGPEFPAKASDPDRWTRQKPASIYEERRKYREEYEQKHAFTPDQQQPSPRQPRFPGQPEARGGSAYQPLPRQPGGVYGDGDQPKLGGYRPPPKSKNKYGDSWDE